MNKRRCLFHCLYNFFINSNSLILVTVLAKDANWINMVAVCVKQ